MNASLLLALLLAGFVASHPGLPAAVDGAERTEMHGHVHGHRFRRSNDVGQLAVLAALAGSSEESGSCCDESGEANTNNRLVDQINLMLAKLQNCGNNNNWGYPYYPYPCYYY